MNPIKWLRQRREEKTRAEAALDDRLVAEAEASPCKNEDMKHAAWAKIGWPCPICTRLEKEQRADEQQTRLAKKIAAELHELQRGAQ